MTREQHSEDVAWLGQQYPEQAGAGTGALASEAPERDVAYRRYDPDRFNPVSGTCNPVAAMYDDLLGRSQLTAGFTGSITVNYRRPTPLLRDLDVAAWVDRVDGRKRWVHGTCHLDGVLLTEAEGLFVAPRQGATMEGIAAHLSEA